MSNAGHTQCHITARGYRSRPDEDGIGVCVCIAQRVVVATQSGGRTRVRNGRMRSKNGSQSWHRGSGGVHDFRRRMVSIARMSRI